MKSKLIVLLVILSCPLFAKEFPDPHGRVNDFAQILRTSTQQLLERQSAELEKATSVELAIVTVPSLGNRTLEDYATRLFNTWGIGKKGKNNGVLILVAPNEHKVRIEVGLGLERILTNALASDIIQKQIVPAFKTGEFDQGVIDGTQRVSDILRAHHP